MNWPAIYQSLDERGYATIPGVLSSEECQHLSGLYQDDHLFRSTINMERYRFGKGEYKYFDYPLPPAIQALRETLYGPLASFANTWMHHLSIDYRYPLTHQQLQEECKAKGQTRSTPLMLRYETGGFNTLHQDLYGEIYFPFQVVFVLSEPVKDFEGGEFVLVEQLPRAQSRVEVIRPCQGEAVIFTTNFRPVNGSRGYYRARVKHGVSPLKSGTRYALGIIFHDAA
jgi:hypothetical protein